MPISGFEALTPVPTLTPMEVKRIWVLQRMPSWLPSPTLQMQTAVSLKRVTWGMVKMRMGSPLLGNKGYLPYLLKKV